MARRRGFWRAILDAMGVTPRATPPSRGGEAGAAVPPPPPSQPPPPPPPTPPISIYTPGPEPGNVNYVPRHTQFYLSPKYQRINTGTVTARWTVGNELYPPDISDVSDIVNSSGKGPGDFVTFTVGGVYFTGYPGQEGNRVSWVTYTFTYEAIADYLDDPDLETATDFVNSLLSSFGVYWEEVYEIHVLDN